MSASVTVRDRAAPARLAARSVDRGALADVAPVLVALVPFAAIIGVQASAGRDPLGGLLGSVLLYAGSAQTSALTLLDQGARVVLVLFTVALINARFLVYSAALAPWFSGQPTWFRWIAPHFIVDQTFGMVVSRDDLGGSRFRRYWLTTGVTIAVVWFTAMAVGVVLGPVVPSSPATVFMPAAIMVGMLVPALHDRPSVVACLVACAMSVVVPLPAGGRVLVATVGGAATGLVAQRGAR